ncbi:MAG: prepilin peptidase [Sphingomonadaceae bacterium]
MATALLVAAFTDIRRREIDNWLTFGIAACAPLFWLTTGLGWVDIGWQLGIGLATFAVLAGLFAIGQMGGGDVKLLTALALWIQPLWFLRLIIVMALIGGLLTAGFALRHYLRKDKEQLAVPYGVAISIAGLWTIASQYMPGGIQGLGAQ